MICILVSSADLRPTYLRPRLSSAKGGVQVNGCAERTDTKQGSGFGLSEDLCVIGVREDVTALEAGYLFV